MSILIRAGNNDKDQSRFKRKLGTKRTKRDNGLFTEAYEAKPITGFTEAYGEKTDNGLFTEAYGEKTEKKTDKRKKRML